MEETDERRRDRRRLTRYTLGAAASLFGVAALAQFIHPGGWAVWPALALLATALVCWVGAARVMRRLDKQ